MTCKCESCTQTGIPDRGHQQCQAIPDQHALDTLVSSITLPAWLDGQAAQTLHQSAAAVQVPCSMQTSLACVIHTAGVARVCRMLHSNADTADGLQAVGDLADIDAKTAKLLATLLQPFLSIGILLMVVRIVLSWYPQVRPPSPVQEQNTLCSEHTLLRADTACHARPWCGKCPINNL